MKWGIKCDSSVNRNILENYIDYLACPDVNLIVCSPDNCSNPTIISACVLDINSITRNVIDDDDTDNNVDLVFSLQIGDYTSGTLPFIYGWSYDNTYLEAIGALNLSTLSLKLRLGADLESIIYHITLGITDASGCSDIKRFYFNSSGIIGDDGYVICPNVGTLQVLPPTL